MLAYKNISLKGSYYVELVISEVKCSEVKSLFILIQRTDFIAKNFCHVFDENTEKTLMNLCLFKLGFLSDFLNSLACGGILQSFVLSFLQSIVECWYGKHGNEVETI